MALLRNAVTQLPEEAWPEMWRLVQGNVTNVGHTLHVANDVESYIENLMKPDLPQAAGEKSVALRVPDEEAKAWLQAKAEGRQMAGAAPWLSIALLIAKAILDLLSKQ